MTTDTSDVPAQAPASPVIDQPDRGASWPWRRSALLLSGAAQLITISALVGADPPVASWARILLAIAPAPLAALAVLVPVRGRLAAVTVACAVLVTGTAGGWLPTGVLFVPALAAMAGAGYKVWCERS